MSRISCQICYEKFTDCTDELVPRRLACSDIFCTKCIKVDLIDGIFFCPECGAENKATTVDDFPIAIVDGESDNSSEVSTGDLSNGRSESPSTDIEVDEVHAPGNFVGNHGRSISESGISFFTNKISEKSKSPSSLRMNRHSSKFHGKCKEPDCNFKVTNHSGYCFKHFQNSDLLLQASVESFTGLEMSSINLVSVEGKRLHMKDSQGGWPEVNPDELIDRFKKQKRMELGEAINLIDRAKAIVSRESTVLRLDPPLITVGDIHGQFYDLLNMFKKGGKPGVDQTYLFLGDYVDRGSFSCEVMLALLALKVTYPDRIYLIRGNHECSSVSGHFGFKEECKMKYGVNVYYRFILLFQSLPLAAVISTVYGDIFACHGGISPHFKTIEEIDSIDRFIEPENDQNSGLMDLLWSDPVTEEKPDNMTDEEFAMGLLNTKWTKNPNRVRAHEVQESGFRNHFHNDFENRITPKHVLVDLGDEYEYAGEDKSPYCFPPGLAEKEFKKIQYECVEHPMPEVTESQANVHLFAVFDACPYMPTRFRDLVRAALYLGPPDSLWPDQEGAPDNEDGSENDSESIASISSYPSSTVPSPRLLSGPNNPTFFSTHDSPLTKTESKISVAASNINQEYNISNSSSRETVGYDSFLPSSSPVGSHLEAVLEESNEDDGDSSPYPTPSTNNNNNKNNNNNSENKIDRTSSSFRGRMSVIIENSAYHSNSVGRSSSSGHHLGSSELLLKSPAPSDNGLVSPDLWSFASFDAASVTDNSPRDGGGHSQPITTTTPTTATTTTPAISFKNQGLHDRVRTASHELPSPPPSSITNNRITRSQSIDVHNSGSRAASRFLRLNSHYVSPYGAGGGGGANGGGEFNATDWDGKKIDDLNVNKRRGCGWKHNRTYSNPSLKYSTAVASDAINELHPTSNFMQRILSIDEAQNTLNAALFQIAEDEKAAISVSDLKMRFERFQSPNTSLSDIFPESSPISNNNIQKREEEILALKSAKNVPKVADLKMKFMGSKNFSPPTLPYSPSSARSHHFGVVSELLERTKNKRAQESGGSPPERSTSSPPVFRRNSASFCHSGLSNSNTKNSLNGEISAQPTRNLIRHSISSPNDLLEQNVGGDVVGRQDETRGSLAMRRAAMKVALLADFDADVDTLPAATTASDSRGGEGTGTASHQSQLAIDSLMRSTSDDSELSRHSRGSVSLPIKSGNSPVNRLPTRVTGFERASVFAAGTDAGTGSISTSSTTSLSTATAATATAGGTEMTRRSGDGLRKSEEGVPGLHATRSKSSMKASNIAFTREELMGLRLMFSLFERNDRGVIEHDDLVAFAEETGDINSIRDADHALSIIDIDGDGKIGVLDFIIFAARLKERYIADNSVSTSTSTGSHTTEDNVTLSTIAENDNNTNIS